METRLHELSQIHRYIEGLDKEVTMVLQNLQWDRKRLLEGWPMSICSYNHNHRLPPDKKKSHEKECFLKSQGYMKDDQFLPDPLDANANTLVKLNTDNINSIINYASSADHLFKKGNRNQNPEPWTLERLQATYTADERRAIHDAVVQAVPSCHDLADLALPCHDAEGQKGSKTKSRTEILAELRDMKRRRTKYRVAAKTKNYSDVLRDVIKTQMELYTEAQTHSTSQVQAKQGYNHPIKLERIETPHKETKERLSQTSYNDVCTKNKREHSSERKAKKHHYNKEHDDREYHYRRDSSSSTKIKREVSPRARIKSDRRDMRNDLHSNRHDKYQSSSRERKRDDYERDNQSSRKHEYKSHRRLDDDRRYYDRQTSESYNEGRKHKKYL
ncbi:unnamed protein product [Parnassius apollo]|uniref:(apollo) hypothetical protein n=1 Tax=Parnassius apollo TaxID=110799 RepID=A0A8S3X9D3_PARAO|nr:unnamed protein product [Parnassius apollo]